MAVKLYVDGAVAIVRKAQKYLTRWQANMSIGRTEAQLVALTNLITCLAEFLNEWHKANNIN